jgi:adenosylcobinamide-phosphate synthase
MVGYKNEQYLRLGWASAKCDDIANYLPARITGVLMVAAAFLLQMDWRTAYRIMRRDARTHESPNSGYPESALAGALQVQLGGVNYYRGIKKVTAHLGDAQKELSEQSIEDAVSVMYLTSALMLLFSLVLLGVLH